MELVVTGAGGFSGSHLVSSLIASGHRVTAIVGRSVGRLDPGLIAHPALKLVRGELPDQLFLPSPVDAVIHAAARSPPPSIRASDLIRDNVNATARLVEYAVDSGAKKFIYLSSLSIYGEIKGPIVDETTAIINPDIYGMTKYLGEVLLREVGTSMHSLSIRLPGIIGRDPVRNWLTSVLKNAQAGAEIRVFNPDAPFNNAVHVQDLCRFVGRALEHAWSGHDAVTIAAAGEISVRRAVETIIETLKSRSKLVVTESAKPSFLVSIAKARSIYGYEAMEIGAMLRKFASENQNQIA